MTDTLEYPRWFRAAVTILLLALLIGQVGHFNRYMVSRMDTQHLLSAFSRIKMEGQPLPVPHTMEMPFHRYESGLIEAYMERFK